MKRSRRDMEVCEEEVVLDPLLDRHGGGNRPLPLVSKTTTTTTTTTTLYVDRIAPSSDITGNDIEKLLFKKFQGISTVRMSRKEIKPDTFRIREISKWFASPNPLQAAAVPRATDMCHVIHSHQQVSLGPQVSQMLKVPQLLCVPRVPQGPQNGPKTSIDCVSLHQFAQETRVRDVDSAASQSAELSSRDLGGPVTIRSPPGSRMDAQDRHLAEEKKKVQEISIQVHGGDVEDIRGLKATDTVKLNSPGERAQVASTGETCISVEERCGEVATAAVRLDEECATIADGSENGITEPGGTKGIRFACAAGEMRSCPGREGVGGCVDGSVQGKPMLVAADTNICGEGDLNGIMQLEKDAECNARNCASGGQLETVRNAGMRSNEDVECEVTDSISGGEKPPAKVSHPTNGMMMNGPLHPIKPTKGKRTHPMMGKSLPMHAKGLLLLHSDRGVHRAAAKGKPLLSIPQSPSENAGGSTQPLEPLLSDCEIDDDRLSSQAACPGTGRNGIHKRRRMATRQKLAPIALERNQSSSDLHTDCEQLPVLSAKPVRKVEPQGVDRRPKRERSAPYWLAQFHHVEVPGAVTPVCPRDEVVVTTKAPLASHSAPIVTRHRNSSVSEKVSPVVASSKHSTTGKQGSRKGLSSESEEKVGEESAKERDDCRISGKSSDCRTSGKSTMDVCHSLAQPAEMKHKNGQDEGISTPPEEKEKQKERERERGAKHPSRADAKGKQDRCFKESLGAKGGKVARQRNVGGHGKGIVGAGLSVECQQTDTSWLGLQKCEGCPKAVCMERVMMDTGELAEPPLNSPSPSSSMSPVHVKEWERLVEWERLPSPAVSPRAVQSIMSPFASLGRSPSPTRSRSRSVSRSRSRSSSPSPSLLPSLAAAVLTTHTHGRGRSSHQLYAVKHVHSKQEMEARAKARLAKAHARGCHLQVASLTADDAVLMTIDSQEAVDDNPAEEEASAIRNQYHEVQPAALPIPAFRPILRQKQTPRGGKGTDRLKGVQEGIQPVALAAASSAVDHQAEEQEPTVLHLFPPAEEMLQQRWKGDVCMVQSQAPLMDDRASAGMENDDVEEEERSGLEVCSDSCSGRAVVGSWDGLGLSGVRNEGKQNVERQGLEGDPRRTEHDDEDDCGDTENDRLRQTDESRSNVKRLRYATFKGCMCCEYSFWDKQKCRRITAKDRA